MPRSFGDAPDPDAPLTLLVDPSWPPGSIIEGKEALVWVAVPELSTTEVASRTLDVSSCCPELAMP